jgi:hypothetical protein
MPEPGPDDEGQPPDKDGPTTPGNAQGVPVPHEQAMEGTSETISAVEDASAVLPSATDQDDDQPAAGDFRDLSN